MRGTQSRRNRDGVLAASGAALMLAALLAIQSMVGSGLLGTKTVTVTVTASDAYEQVADAYSSHLMQLGARNITALLGGYERNATVKWTGVVPGAAGTYSGLINVMLLFSSFTGKFVNFSLSDEYQSMGVNDSVPVVNSTFDFLGYSSVVGYVNGTVVAQDVYGHAGDSSWLISRETWDFTRYNEQFPCC